MIKDDVVIKYNKKFINEQKFNIILKYTPSVLL